MYDSKFWSHNWHVEIEFDEDDTHTHATVRAQLSDGETMTTLGDAYRHPQRRQPADDRRGDRGGARADRVGHVNCCRPRRRGSSRSHTTRSTCAADPAVALAVCLLFDRRSERAVRALWDRLEQQGVPSLRSHTHGRHVPHVSYAVLRSWDQAAVTAALVELGDGAPVDLSFDGVGLFRRGRTWLLAGVGAESCGTPAAGCRRRQRHRRRVAQALRARNLAAALFACAARDVGSAARRRGRGVGRVASAGQAGPRGPGQQRDRRAQPAAGPTVTKWACCPAASPFICSNSSV